MSMVNVITDDIICDFRRFLKAFSDVNTWPSEVVQLALTEGDCMTGGSTWGSFDITKDTNFKKRGMYYCAAHYLAVEYGSTGAADPTAIKSDARLNIASKSVGDESVSYRVTAMESTADDFFSTTFYGQMFVNLRRRATATPLCV